MRHDTDRYKVFSRRAVLLSGGTALLFSTLVGRLYYLQVLEADRYRVLAEENRISFRLLSPPRGRILDRFGEELANNQQNYRVLLIPEQAGSIDETLTALGRLVAIDEYDRRKVMRDIGRNPAFLPVTVLENLSWPEFSRINVHMSDLPGVQPGVGETRYYPFGGPFAHIVGYVGPVSEDEQTGDPLLELPDFRTGKSGVEKASESLLRGRAGNRQIEVNATGRVVRELERNDGQPGGDVVLTIDSVMQNFVFDRLGEESGAVVLIDVHNGEVLALVSTPTFDPNAFNLGLSRGRWQALLENNRKPLLHRAISGQYPPGSTFKMVVAMAALEAGTVAAEHRVFCSGELKFGNHTFHCWKRGGHGELSLVEAIEQSCDIHFYDVARRTGIDPIGQMARRLGLGKQLGLGLNGERPGLVPSREWKLALRGEPWQQGETLITGIGQGYLLTTPLQLAFMAGQIANGGFALRPRLLRRQGAEGKAAAKPRSLELSSAALRLVREGMERVVNGKRGTARRARIREPEMAMAGKSGSVQVRRITKAQRLAGLRKNSEKPWEERDHALFVAYAPMAAPRYAVSVIIEHGGGGSAAAAPVARDVLREVQRRDPLRLPGLAGTGGRGAGKPPVKEG